MLVDYEVCWYVFGVDVDVDGDCMFLFSWIVGDVCVMVKSFDVMLCDGVGERVLVGFECVVLVNFVLLEVMFGIEVVFWFGCWVIVVV